MLLCSERAVVLYRSVGNQYTVVCTVSVLCVCMMMFCTTVCYVLVLMMRHSQDQGYTHYSFETWYFHHTLLLASLLGSPYTFAVGNFAWNFLNLYHLLPLHFTRYFHPGQECNLVLLLGHLAQQFMPYLGSWFTPKGVLILIIGRRRRHESGCTNSLWSTCAGPKLGLCTCHWEWVTF